ncbi:MAG TPA: transporter substrate-binding domain-containing protein [Rhodospirillales bacterium]|nr:transporter substrate-binding domain-containing protein [Rhodospirillales bacterium]
MSVMKFTGRTNCLAAVFAVMVALPLLMVPTDAGAKSLQEIVKDKKIRLGTIPYHPSTIKDPKTGEWSGFYVDTLRNQFKTLKIEIEFVETKWGTFSGALQSDQFDVFVGGSFATPLRALAINFSKAFMYMGYSAGARKADAHKYKTVADIDKPGVKVAVAMGSGGHEYVKQNFKNAEIVALDTGDLTAPFMEVLAGRVDVGIQDAVATALVASKQPNLVDLYGSDPFNVLPISFAVAKGNLELLNFLNTLVDYMRINGKWRKGAEKYKEDLGGFFEVKPNYVPFGGSGRTGQIK